MGRHRAPKNGKKCFYSCGRIFQRNFFKFCTRTGYLSETVFTNFWRPNPYWAPSNAQKRKKVFLLQRSHFLANLFQISNTYWIPIKDIFQNTLAPQRLLSALQIPKMGKFVFTLVVSFFNRSFSNFKHILNTYESLLSQRLGALAPLRHPAAPKKKKNAFLLQGL